MTGAQPGASSPARTDRWRSFRDAFLDSSRACQVAQQQAGIPTDLVGCAARSLGVSETVLLTLLGLEAATPERITSPGERLGSNAARHLMFIGAIQRLAEGAFGDPGIAAEWLTAPNLALGGVAPVTVLDTPAGRHEVSRLLHAIAYGGVA